MSDVKILATGLGFPEGPVACADGSIVLKHEQKNGGRLVNEDVRSFATFTAVLKRVWHE